MSDREAAPLRDQLRRLMESEGRLDAEQLARLEANFARPARPRPPARRIWLGAALAAAAGLALAVTFGWPASLFGPRHDAASIATRIAREVLTNHTRIKALDLEASSLAEVRDRLDRLEFVLVRPSRLGESVQLRGARYCTLQGQLAAQLVYESADGERITHYQTAYDPDRFGPIPDLAQGEVPLLVAKRGLAVSIWREQGVLIASGAPAE